MTARARTVATVVVIVAAVAAVMMGIWGAPVWSSLSTGEEVDNPKWAWMSYWFGGGAAVAGVLLTAKSTALARALVVIGALVLLAGALGYRSAGPVTLLTLVLPALLMLLAAPFIGPAPLPRD
ncbi:MAG TPA: hypothetical protein VJ803_12955 [Gemmatimonadaceae bacterium]|nr:hypothetical protein [Gemmatimonadaceae bacterium]